MLAKVTRLRGNLVFVCAWKTTMITQFFVLSPRGDTIISKQCTSQHSAAYMLCMRLRRVPTRVALCRVLHTRSFTLWVRVCVCSHRLLCVPDRGDAVRGIAEIFFRKVKFWKGDAPPVFVRHSAGYFASALCALS